MTSLEIVVAGATVDAEIMSSSVYFDITLPNGKSLNAQFRYDSETTFGLKNNGMIMTGEGTLYVPDKSITHIDEDLYWALSQTRTKLKDTLEENRLKRRIDAILDMYADSNPGPDYKPKRQTPSSRRSDRYGGWHGNKRYWN